MDKYQGQQNDYVLLSLVRTRAVGHIRDVRRLIVAMSRARLGLYIFGRTALFGDCYELAPTMRQLLARPAQLALHPTEHWQVGGCASHVRRFTCSLAVVSTDGPLSLTAVGQVCSQ